MPARSSSSPALVVPAVATAANTPSAPSSAARSASPCIRPASSAGTGSTSTSMKRAAARTEEWTSSLHATRQRSGAPPRSWRACSRAACSADRLPLVPPWTKQPPALRGQPGEVGEPAQRLVLGVHRARALEPAAAVDRAGAEQQLDVGGGGRRRRRDEREVARMVDRDGQRQQHVAEAPQRLLRAEALGGHGRAGQRRDLGRRQRAAELGRVLREPLQRGLQHVLAERAQLRRELVHQPTRATFAAWIFFCAPERRASGSFASPRSCSACT